MKAANHLKEREEKSGWRQGLYNGNSWNEGSCSRKEVAIAKACVTMKALYGMESTAKPNGRTWVAER